MVLRLNSTLLVALPLLLFAAAHGLVSYSEWRTVSGSSPGNGGGGGPSNDGSLNSGGVPTVDPPVVSSPATGLDANGNPANLNLSTVIPVAPPVPIPTVVTPYGPRGADHYAHAVPPKLEPQLDEDGDEFAMVPLSSGNSHTHLVKDGKAGEITRYTWSKLSADEPPVVTEPLASGSSAIKRFPVGKTRVRLEVEDNGGNTHQDDFVVDVEAPVQNGVYCYYYKGVTAAQRLPLDPRSSPKPVWAAAAPTMDFADASAFPAQGVGAAGKAFAQRCVFSLRVGATAATTFSVSGSGAVTLAIDNIFQALDIVGDAPSVTVTLAAGNHPVQVMYFAEDAGAAKLLLRVNGEALATKAALWDMRTVVRWVLRWTWGGKGWGGAHRGGGGNACGPPVVCRPCQLWRRVAVGVGVFGYASRLSLTWLPLSILTALSACLLLVLCVPDDDFVLLFSPGSFQIGTCPDDHHAKCGQQAGWHYGARQRRQLLLVRLHGHLWGPPGRQGRAYQPQRADRQLPARARRHDRARGRLIQIRGLEQLDSLYLRRQRGADPLQAAGRHAGRA